MGCRTNTSGFLASFLPLFVGWVLHLCAQKEGVPSPEKIFTWLIGGKQLSDSEVPDFGAAADGDADRNMILGKRFFVTPR